jgi:hypothetical protein
MRSRRPRSRLLVPVPRALVCAFARPCAVYEEAARVQCDAALKNGSGFATAATAVPAARARHA